MQRIFELGAVLAVVLLLPGTASACSWFWCGFPADIVPEDKAHVPANGGLLYLSLYSELDEQATLDALTLTRIDTGDLVDIEVSPADVPHFSGNRGVSLVMPTAPLEPGASYILNTASTTNEACDGTPGDPISVTFTADQAAEPPTAFGSIVVATSELRTEEVAEDGGCSHSQSVLIAEIETTLDPSMQPWADSAAYETLVDGETWTPARSSGRGFPLGSSWTGRGTDAVYAICNDNPYSEHSWLEPGEHEVQMRIHLPALGVVLESNALTLDFDCATGTVTGPTADPGDGPNADPGNGPNATRDEPGGCATSTAPPGAVGLLLFGLALGAVLRRRK